MDLQKKRRALLRLEELETRWVPATVHFTNGLLAIGPSPGEATLNLTVTQTSANTFQVVDGSSSIGTYGGVSNLSITGTNGADTITVNLNGNTYTGNLLVNSGNGSDSISVKSTGAAGAILGNTSIVTGSGSDSVLLNWAAQTGNVTFGGSVQVTNPLGRTAIGSSTGGIITKINGPLSITGGDNIALGFFTAPRADVFGGNVTINTAITSLPTDIAIADGEKLNNNLNITTGSGNDSVVLGAITVAGNTTINTGTGNNDVAITAHGGTTGSYGNLSVSGGDGNDNFIIGNVTGVSVLGNLSVNYGSGTDSVTLVQGLSVFGNSSLVLGNGNDSVTSDATVFGNASFRLGNGADTVTIGHAPSGQLFWNSGNGAASVTLGDANTLSGESWNVQMQFGTGSDSLTLDTSTPQTISGSVNSQNPGGNTFTQGSNWTIVPPWSFNF